MSAEHDELFQLMLGRTTTKAVERILAAGYRKPRTIKSPAQLEALPFGSAVQTSDYSDVVVLKSEGRYFRNQSGYELSVEDLWRYGTQPFTVIFEPETVTARDLLGAAPDFTGGLSVDEYMHEQRGRGQK